MTAELSGKGLGRGQAGRQGGPYRRQGGLQDENIVSSDFIRKGLGRSWKGLESEKSPSRSRYRALA